MAKKRTAAAWFELIVLIAVILLLTGMLLPAVLQVREKAGKKSIENNLKQVCLATHSYHDVYKRFPPASGQTGVFAVAGVEPLGVHLMPFLEQLPLQQLYLNDYPKAPTWIKIPPYCAELDVTTTDFIRVQNFAANLRVFTDIGFNSSFEKSLGSGGNLPPQAFKDMMCSTNLNRSFPDGTSNTIAYATRHGYTKAGGARGAVENACSLYDVTTTNPGGAFFGFNPATTLPSAKETTGGWQANPGPGDIKCGWDRDSVAHGMTADGLQVGLCDATVRMITPKMSARTWNQALQPNDQYPMGADW